MKFDIDRRKVAVPVMLAAFAVWLTGAWSSPFLSPGLADRQTYLKELVKQESFTANQAREEELARGYWNANPDVKADAYFGEHGQLGIRGAREHYLRHGKREGRHWPGDDTRPASKGGK